MHSRRESDQLEITNIEMKKFHSLSLRTVSVAIDFFVNSFCVSILAEIGQIDEVLCKLARSQLIRNNKKSSLQKQGFFNTNRNEYTICHQHLLGRKNIINEEVHFSLQVQVLTNVCPCALICLES